MKYLFLILFVSCATASKAPKEKAYNDIYSYLKAGPIHKPVLTAEGKFVMAFAPEVVPFLKKKLTNYDIKRLQLLLKDSLTIQLTERGFAKAADRELGGEKDDTNYDAIWVRDSGWIYFYFQKMQRNEKARKLILALWDYYATPHQQMRFKNIIKSPLLARDGTMHVPHIRFNGSSPKLEDVYEGDQPQNWNHRQNDAHGIFLVALAEAFRNDIVSVKDISKDRVSVLKMFPVFFEKIRYERYPGAGAWEEINKVNTSSVAMVVKGIEQWSDLFKKNRALRKIVGWDAARMQRLVKRGYKTIKANLYTGGESSNHGPYSIEFRQEDAALFNIFLPMPLKKIGLEDKRYVVTILEKLKRTFGILRYENDSYQSGNYWVQSPEKVDVEGAPSATGDSSSKDHFLKRFKNFIPGSEAQWFFDSKLAMIRLQLMQEEKSRQMKKIDMMMAQVHLKRALGQLTGNMRGGEILAADGKAVRSLQATESINTVVVSGKRYYLPSPITPLNWAKASLGMALEDLKNNIK
jgi:hypothetical protein